MNFLKKGRRIKNVFKSSKRIFFNKFKEKNNNKILSTISNNYQIHKFKTENLNNIKKRYFFRKFENLEEDPFKIHKASFSYAYGFFLSLTALNTGIGIYNLWQRQKNSINGKVNSLVKDLETVKDLPMGIEPSQFGITQWGFIERKQKIIENLFDQSRTYHFSFVHGDQKCGKTTYLLELLKDRKNVLYFQCKSGDTTERILSKGLGFPDDIKNLDELLHIIDEALTVISKNKTNDEDFEKPLIVVEDILSLPEKEDVKQIAKKFGNLYDRNKCSVIFVSGNRHTYNYLTDNVRFSGFKEKLRLYRMFTVPLDRIKLELMKNEVMNDEEEVDKLLEYTGANFGDIRLALHFYRKHKRNLDKALWLLTNAYEDNFKALFERKKDEVDLFILFNIFDNLRENGRFRKSYYLVWNDPSLFYRYEHILQYLNEQNVIKRYLTDKNSISLCRPVLRKVYERLLDSNLEIQERRKQFERWKKEKGYE